MCGLSLNLLIVECFSGGRYSDTELSSTVLSEAYGMQRNLITDCKTAGNKVTTLMDSRLKKFNPPNEADHTVWISAPNEFYAKLKELSGIVDEVYVIAPESDHVMENLVDIVESSGGTSLNCSVDGIKHVSNKVTFYEQLNRVGLKFPETILVGIDEEPDHVRRLVKDLGYPIIFKPMDGVSCSGLSIVRDGADITDAIKKLICKSTGKQFIAQKLINGKAASACIFSNGTKAMAVSLNRQLVTLSSPDGESQYWGGFLPFNHVLEEETLKIAEKAVEAVKGLKGYIGVDLVLTSEEAFVMEINPRLTVSYVGLRKVVGFNPAKAIIDAMTKRKLPKDCQIHSYAYFSKIKTPSHSHKLAETYNLDQVVSPPFPVEENQPAYALVAATSTSLGGARSAFHHAKESLLSLYSGGN